VVGDIWGTNGSNLVVRTANAVSIGTSTIDNSGSARGTNSGAGDNNGHREAQRYNR